MSELFTVLPPGEAFAAFARACSKVERSETVPLEAALGRVAAEDVIAGETLPGFARATMDGYAVRAADTHGASEQSPAYLRVVDDVPTGVVPGRAVGVREAVRTHTGAMIPPGADAVVMVEDTNLHGDEVEVLAASPPGDNVLAVGEDVVAGAVAVPAGRRLRAAELGGLAALGVTRVRVRARPRVAILSTGDEVVPADAVPGGAQVRDVNATTVAAVVSEAGGVPVRCGIAPDDAAALERALRAAMQDADAVVLSAGSSVSVRDLTASVVARLGAPGVLVHGIAIKPGKPTVLAVCGGTPVVGLPGNPASALVVAWRIVRPLVRLLGGESATLVDEHETIAVLDVPVPSRPGREEYVPCTLARGDDGALHATPVFGASNLIFTLIRADALIAVPLDRSGLGAGERVRVIVP
ncbi:MAG TPA: gephyrin-like molybdotransferase Glp [Candidatus Elarobacter sp.]|jgi:molybdopterin molybdotransferase|nr:gephyrin-like molybdotransferase Glp [Candidatus Elarobacter sp.]